MYTKDTPPKQIGRFNLKRVVFASFGFLVVFGLAGYIALARWYNTNLKPLSETANATSVNIQVDPGTASTAIADLLEEKEVIRSATAFNVYLRLNSLTGSLQAGEYVLSPNLSVSEIVGQMTNGTLTSRQVTLLPGKRLDQLQASLVSQGFTESDVEAAFNASLYRDHPISAYKPLEASLEGYLFPETFEVVDSTTAEDVVRKSLDVTYAAITPELRAGFEAQGLSVHDAVIISSIVEKEVSKESDKPKVAQVFLKRLREGIQLGSDVTFFYASAVFGGPALPSLDNPYNTRLYGGLPPGPISNFSVSTMRSVANPADTQYLYFVAGDNGTTYFNETLQGHNSDAATYCIELCKL